MAFADVFNRRLVALLRGFINAVLFVDAQIGAVGWNDHRLQFIDLLKLVSLGVGRARHTGEFFKQAEVVLEGDGAHHRVLRLNLYAFFGFDGLHQALRPAASGHQAAREFVHDGDRTVLQHILLVAQIQMLGAQRGRDMVHQHDVGTAVERGALVQKLRVAQNLLDFFVALVGDVDGAAFFVDRVVARFGHAQARHRVGFAFLAAE